MTRRPARVVAVLAAAAFIVAGLSGCGSAAKKGKTGVTYEVVTVTVNGVKVPCVLTSKGGVWCAEEDR